MREGSTVTRRRALAEAFSHKPAHLGYGEYGVGEVTHDGAVRDCYLYVVDEPVSINVDIYQHPRTTMSEGAEFLTSRPLRMKLIAALP